MRYQYKSIFLPWRGNGASLQNLDAMDIALNELGAERWRLEHIREITIGLLLVFVREVQA